MFYIKLKDGREITTDMRSDDIKEFSKFLEAELGDQTAELFDVLIHGASSIDSELLVKYKKCILGLSNLVAQDQVDKDTLEKIVSELKDIYIDLT